MPTRDLHNNLLQIFEILNFFKIIKQVRIHIFLFFISIATFQVFKHKDKVNMQNYEEHNCKRNV